MALLCKNMTLLSHGKLKFLRALKIKLLQLAIQIPVKIQRPELLAVNNAMQKLLKAIHKKIVEKL